MATLGMVIFIIISLYTLYAITYGSWLAFEEFTDHGRIWDLIQHFIYSLFLLISCILLLIIDIPKLHIVWMVGFGIMLIKFSIKLVESILKRKKFKNMTRRDINKERFELIKKREEIIAEWKAYDKQYPVLPGAYKPADYDYRQKDFLERESDSTDSISELPDTIAENLFSILFIILGLTGIMSSIWFFFGN
jgi:hypothetical protein